MRIDNIINIVIDNSIEYENGYWKLIIDISYDIEIDMFGK